MTTPVSSMALVAFGAFLGSFGGVFLKRGAEQMRGGLLKAINRDALIGVTIFVLSSIFVVIGLKNGELSVLYPMVAFGYVFTLLWSRLFFHEELTRGKFLALALILGGITMMGIGAR